MKECRRAIECSIKLLLEEVLKFQLKHSGKRPDGLIFSWNRGSTRNLPIINEQSATRRLVDLIRSKLGQGLRVERPYAAHNRLVDAAVVAKQGAHVIPIEVKGYPTVQPSKRAKGFEKDIGSLALAAGSGALAYYVVLASFDNDDSQRSNSPKNNWVGAGFEKQMHDILKSDGFRGECKVFYLQMHIDGQNASRRVLSGQIKTNNVLLK